MTSQKIMRNFFIKYRIIFSISLTVIGAVAFWFGIKSFLPADDIKQETPSGVIIPPALSNLSTSTTQKDQETLIEIPENTKTVIARDVLEILADKEFKVINPNVKFYRERGSVTVPTDEHFPVSFHINRIFRVTGPKVIDFCDPKQKRNVFIFFDTIPEGSAPRGTCLNVYHDSKLPGIYNISRVFLVIELDAEITEAPLIDPVGSRPYHPGYSFSPLFQVMYSYRNEEGVVIDGLAPPINGLHFSLGGYDIGRKHKLFIFEIPPHISRGGVADEVRLLYGDYLQQLDEARMLGGTQGGFVIDFSLKRFFEIPG